MDRNFEIKTRTFFEIPPAKRDYPEIMGDRIVFMGQGFDLNHIELIAEPVMVSDMWYQFHVMLKSDRRIEFDFKRKADCLMAQRELSRAWSRTGEFNYADADADVDVGEETKLG